MLTLVLVSNFDVVVSWVIVLRNEIRAEPCQHLMNVEISILNVALFLVYHAFVL